MRKFNDLTGRRFGKWTALHRASEPVRPIYWYCVCDCGKTGKAQAGSLLNGSSTGCRACARTKHGGAYTKLYRVWVNMHQRCKNVNHPQFKDYGGRGIAVCSRWEDYQNFVEDMGACAMGLTLERVDNSAGYNGTNCVWTSRGEQIRNSRTAKLTEVDVLVIRASTASNSELAKIYNVTSCNIWQIRTYRTWRL